MNAGNLSKFEFCLPPLPIQKKIVQKLDDILGQLEEKKKAVFSIIEQKKVTGREKTIDNKEFIW